MAASATFILTDLLRMPRTPQKPVTPGSVKVLMVVEAGIIVYLAFWLYSEYLYNVYFRIYVDSMILQHLTTYTAIIGLSIGLAGSVATLMLWRNLKQTRLRMETGTSPRLRGVVDRILSGISALDEFSPARPAKPATTPAVSAQPNLTQVLTQPSEQQKK